MFAFFGLFADPVGDVPRRISEIWPDLKPIRIDRPVSVVAVRFTEHHYEPEREELPELVIQQIERLSAESPAARFLLLRSECFGENCENWGQIFRNGTLALQADGEKALGRLIAYFGVDLGPDEIFDPLSRNFAWD